MSPNDRTLLRNLAQRIMQQEPHMAERARTLLHGEALQPFMQEAMASVPRAMTGAPDDALALETIVVRTGRPVLLVVDDDYRLEGAESEVWQGRLDLPAIRQALRRVLPAVGRIEVENHRLPWIGTGWLVDDDVIVTNRHVAEEFCVRGASGFIFRRGWPDPQTRMRARVDFKEEQGALQANEFPILDILHMEDDDGPDIAFLKVERRSTQGQLLAGKIPLASRNAEPKQYVATIGYPAADSRVPDQELVRWIFGDVYNVKRLAPGQTIRVRDGLVLHDCSTLGGNSGSPIVDLESGAAIGLHFSGLFLQENRGVPAAVVADRLKKLHRDAIYPAVAISPGARPPAVAALGNAPQTSSDVYTLQLEVAVPIEISVRVAAARVGASKDAADLPGGIERAVATARTLLASRPNVLAIRDGYVFRNGWITDEQAVVVVARDEESVAASGPAIPATIAGFPVEVRPPGPWDFAESLGLRETLEALPQTTYSPPAGVQLQPVEESMKVTCHLCPDAGWPTLRDFLAGTRRQLVIGMYDFTAPHIVKAVLSAVRQSRRRLTMVLQQGASLGGGAKKFDIPEEDTVADYLQKLGDRFAFVWASVGNNRRFASAYHIKVAVRDGAAVWLSSGNWQSSNQPERSVEPHDLSWEWLMKYNREWNVVIENGNLARQYEAFLKHDFAQAQADAGIEAAALPALDFFVEEPTEALSIPPGAPTYFQPLVVERSVRVQPLLTPDNYQEHVLRLIESAEEQILFQNQSFNILDDSFNDPRFAALADALVAKQRQGIDVRIIIRGEFDPERYVERLKKRGFDTNRIRLQDRCHTKGIVVDRKAALLGSHNWTNQGALVNRDASLIFFDEEIAGYFANAFWFDWKKLARQSVGGKRRVQVADGRESANGMTRVSWRDVF